MKNSKPIKIFNSFRYVEDCKSGIYHTPRCQSISSISAANLRVCCNPIQSGLKPCSICIKETINMSLQKKKPKNKKKEVMNSQEAIIKEQLTQICSVYKLKVKFIGTTAFITSSIGEWFFDYYNLQLHHRNSEVRPYSKGTYHIQAQTFKNPKQILAYIYRHEQATARRLQKEANVNKE